MRTDPLILTVSVRKLSGRHKHSALRPRHLESFHHRCRAPVSLREMRMRGAFRIGWHSIPRLRSARDRTRQRRRRVNSTPVFLGALSFRRLRGECISSWRRHALAARAVWPSTGALNAQSYACAPSCMHVSRGFGCLACGARFSRRSRGFRAAPMLGMCMQLRAHAYDWTVTCADRGNGCGLGDRKVCREP